MTQTTDNTGGIIIKQPIDTGGKPNITPDPNYELVPPQKKGIQCGQCGMKFDKDKAMGYVCSNNNCPVFIKATC